ncbi:unnamed protein product, partial [Ixodes persulcatus]
RTSTDLRKEETAMSARKQLAPPHTDQQPDTPCQERSSKQPPRQPTRVSANVRQKVLASEMSQPNRPNTQFHARVRTREKRRQPCPHESSLHPPTLINN